MSDYIIQKNVGGDFSVRHNINMNSFEFQMRVILGPHDAPHAIHATVNAEDAARLTHFILEQMPGVIQKMVMDALTHKPVEEQGLRPTTAIHDELQAVPDKDFRKLFQVDPDVIDRHDFDPGGRAGWAAPRCKICREFEDHPIHQKEANNE